MAAGTAAATRTAAATTTAKTKSITKLSSATTAGAASKDTSSTKKESTKKKKKNLFSAKEARALAASKKNLPGNDDDKTATTAATARESKNSSLQPPKKKKKKKKKAAKTTQNSFRKAHEESFVEQVRNMWRSAVLETVGLGTDAAFLRKIGINQQDELGNDTPAAAKGAAASSAAASSAVPESDEPMVTTVPLTRQSSFAKSIPVRDLSSPPLGIVRPPNSARGNPSVFSSNPEQFPCKRCGQFIAVDDMVSHASHCGDSVRAQEAIDRAVESRAPTSSPLDDEWGGKDDDDNGFVCQLCNLKVLDADMATHPATCPGLNPTGAGIFWGPSNPATSTSTSSSSPAESASSSSRHHKHEAAVDDAFLKEDMLDGGGAVFLGAVDDDFGTHFGGLEDFSGEDFDMYDDGDDDEEPLIGGGTDVDNDERIAADGGIDFLGFSKRWDENNRNVEGGLPHQAADHPGGFFSATGVFHASESPTVFNQSGEGEEEGSASDDFASDYSAADGEGGGGIGGESSDYTDEDEDAEPMLASESQLSALERALQGKPRGGTESLLVFA